MEPKKKIASRALAMLTAGDWGTAPYDREGLLIMIHALPDETASYLHEVIEENEKQYPDERTLIQTLVYMLERNASIQDIEDTMHLCTSNELIYERLYDMDAWDHGESHFPIVYLKELLFGLRRYEDIEGFPYDKTVAIRRQGPQLMEQCQALIIMADFLEVFHEYQMEYGVTMIHDPEMAELVAAYPDKVGVMIDLIAVREDDTAFPIREIVSGDVHQSLADGII
jgi:hypothetical protein